MRTLLDALAGLKSRATSSQPRHFSLIDFGTDTVKAVVVRKENRSVRILGYGIAPAEGHSLGGGRAEVAALSAIADAALEAAEDQTETADGGKVVPDEVLFCIPAQLTRGECFSVRQTRMDPARPIAPREVNSAWERVERLARERLPTLGDDGVDWKPLALTPGIISVDGHQVTDPTGLKGEEISLTAFGVAMWPSVLRASEAMAKRLELNLVNIVATPQALASIVPQREAILLNVGAQGTGLHLVQNDALVSTAWWPEGGEFFTRRLALAFHCPSEEAEALKRAYARHALSEKDNGLVASSLVKPVSFWLEIVIAKLRKMVVDASTLRPSDSPLDPNRTNTLPGRIYITGGGSFLPDLSQALRSLEASADLHFRRSLEIEPLGRAFGLRTPGQLALLNVPPHPLSDLLAPAISLATCLE